MNKSIERKIRQAELEYVLTKDWEGNTLGHAYGISFQNYLEKEIIRGYFRDEANELIDIYAGE